MRKSETGFQLIELLVAAAIAALALMIATPSLVRLSSRLSVRLAADEIVGAMREARAFAIRHSTHVGLKFKTNARGAVSWALYRDGDGDGVLSADIESGVDPLAAPERSLGQFGRVARLGFPPGVPPRDPSDPRRRLDRLADPVRFNRSDIASFSPLEGATPGSVYVTDGVRELVAVRIDSRSGRARIAIWDADADRWR